MKKIKGRMCLWRISGRSDNQRGIASQVVKNGARPRSARYGEVLAAAGANYVSGAGHRGC